MAEYTMTGHEKPPDDARTVHLAPLEVLDVVGRIAARRPHVAVVGDAILDEWISGTADHKANGPVFRVSPVASTVNGHLELGGAANVANQLSYMARVTPVFMANDQLANLPRRHAGYGRYCLRDSCPYGTPVKRRIVSDGRSFARIDSEGWSCDCTARQAKLTKKFLQDLDEGDSYDAVLVSDYGKGALDFHDCIKIISIAASRPDVPFFIDTTRHQFWHLAMFASRANRGATDTPPLENLYHKTAADECLKLAGPNVSGIHAAEFAAAALFSRTVATSGHWPPGFVNYTESGEFFARSIVPAIPHLLRSGIDYFNLDGCGDVFSAWTTLALACGEPIEKAAAVGWVAGRRAARMRPIRSVLTQYDVAGNILPTCGKVFGDRAVLCRVLADRHKRQRIAVVNGCFDPFHAGHLALFDMASRCADVVVALVNDDESCRRLKGDRSPLIPIEARSYVLSSCDLVTYVYPFSEDTPTDSMVLMKAALGRKIDAVVKGPDYKDKGVPEGEYADKTVVMGATPFLLSSSDIKRGKRRE